MVDRRVHIAIPMALTLLFHVMLGGGLFAAGKLIDRDKPPDVIEIEIEPPRAKKQKKKQVVRQPPKVVEEQPKPVEDKVKPPPDEPKKRRVTQRRTPPTVAPPTVEPPAPGDNTDDAVPAPAPTVNLGADFMNPTDGVPVENDKPKTRRVGTGGSGTNTGGGGKADSKGTTVAPVSVASIKKQATPIGNTDYFNAGKDYPPDAKRLGVEGKVKVKLTVDDTGKVVKRRLVTKLGHGLDKLALKLAKKLRFDPAIDTNDQRVASVLVWTFNFKLPK